MIKKKTAGDFVYTFIALLLVNVVLQIVIYPIINRFYSSEILGEIVYYTGVIYTLSASIGGAVANQKLLLRDKYKHTNSDFNAITLGINVIIFCFLFVIALASNIGIFSAFLYGTAGCLVFLRYYAEVEFRLTKNFKGYLFYYILVSFGYLIGLGVFLLTGLWYFIFIIGESIAVAYVLFKGSIFKPQPKSGEFAVITKLVFILSVSYLLGALAAHYYKIFINLYFGGDDVTVYYVSSFFGKSLDLVITPITTLMISYLSTKNKNIANLSVKKVLSISIIAGILLYIGFVVATPIYCGLLYSNLYERVFSINFIVNIAQSFSVVSSILIVLILIKYGTKAHFIVQAIFVAIYVISSTVLSVLFGLMGFAIGASIGYFCKCIMIFIISYIGRRKNV